MSYTRRDFLRRLGLTASALPLAASLGCDETFEPVNADAMAGFVPAYDYEGEEGPETMFSHGVASGDPLANAVILWTRVSPADPTSTVEVYWEVAADPEVTVALAAGTVTTDATRDFTVKVDVTGLDAGETYYYRFRSQDRVSVTGRTRTAAIEDIDRLRIGVASCSNYSRGFFHVYKQLASRHDLDLVVHLGDYIYEYGSTGVNYSFVGANGEPVDRSPLPPVEITTLKDYRVRYAQYRTDPDLQEAHRQHPFVCIWDDHETANNSYADGAQNHSPETEGAWADRKMAATRAYFEWMPIREVDMMEGRLWRAFSFGGLLDLIMLDTRIWGRAEQAQNKTTAYEPGRSLLGEDQQEWLFETLRESSATWRFLGQQVMMGHLGRENAPINLDQWDGYDDARAKLFDLIQDEAIEDVVVLTGDIHTSWAIDLSSNPYDPEVYDKESGEGSLAVEFVTPSVNSPSLAEVPEPIVERLARFNPHIKFFELTRHGYLIVDITPERTQSAWFLLDTITEAEFEEEVGAIFRVDAGAPFLIQEEEAAPPRDDYPDPAP